MAEYWPVIAGVAVVSCQWGSVMMRLTVLEKAVEKLQRRTGEKDL